MTSSNRKKLISLTSWDHIDLFSEIDVIFGKSSANLRKASARVREGSARQEGKKEGGVGGNGKKERREGWVGGVSDDVIKNKNEKIKKVKKGKKIKNNKNNKKLKN